MTTKEQERKALDQIRKIVESLGEDSYIGYAFEGCFEDAEYNIQNDCAMSWCNRAQTAEQACDLRRNEAHELHEKNEKLKKELDEAKKQLQERAFMAQEMANRKAEAEDLVEKLREEVRELNCYNNEMINEIADKDIEIMQLKAKLYDLIVK